MEIKERAEKIVFNGITLAVMSILSMIAPLMYYSFRFGWVYVDNSLFNGFCMTLFWFMVVGAILGVFIDVCMLYKVKLRGVELSETKLLFTLQIVHIVLTFVFTLVWIIFMAVSGGESIPVGFKFLAEGLPVFLLIYGGLVLMIFFPKVANVRLKTIFAGIILFMMFLMLVITIFPCYPYSINSHPIVIDNGKEYSVVFSTNDLGTGYIEYAR